MFLNMKSKIGLFSKNNFSYFVPILLLEKYSGEVINEYVNSSWVIISLILVTSGLNEHWYYKEKLYADHF